MIRIAAVEDEDQDYKDVESSVKNYFTTQDPQPYSLKRFESSEIFLSDYVSGNYDLIFMDIDLGETTGVNLARTLRQRGDNTAIVFLTKLSHYAINAYEVNALDYILKPISSYSFNLKMPRILHLVDIDTEQQVTVSTKSYIQRLYISDIYYIEVIKHSIIYHTKKGTFEERNTMKNIEQKFSSCNFYKCNNCYLVNLKHVTLIHDNTAVVGGDNLIISRSKKNDFINAVTNYIGGQM